jgi:hypothetical protein
MQKAFVLAQPGVNLGYVRITTRLVDGSHRSGVRIFPEPMNIGSGNDCDGEHPAPQASQVRGLT